MDHTVFTTNSMDPGSDLERGMIPPAASETPTPVSAQETPAVAAPLTFTPAAAQETPVAAPLTFPPPPTSLTFTPPAQGTPIAAPLTFPPPPAAPAQETPVASPETPAAPEQETPAAAPLTLTSPPPAQETPIAAAPPPTFTPPAAQESPIAAPESAAPEQEAPAPAPKKWLPQVKKALGLLSKDETLLNHGIYTVPARLKSSTSNDDALSPRIVSIGPFHRGKPGLLAMHEQKLIYLSFLLHRTPHPVLTFDLCCLRISSPDHFKIYADNVGFGPDHPDPHKLLEIVLIDACFLIELLLRFWNPELADSYDPIFNNHWIVSTLHHDLLLLENQIPFFVLETAFDVVFQNSLDHLDHAPDLKTLAKGFFAACLNKVHYDHDQERNDHNPLHFLDMLHRAYLLPDYALYYQEHDQEREVLIEIEIAPVLRSSTQQLLAAGVKIEKRTRKHLLDVSFEDQTLKIPPLVVDRKAWSVLKNLVILEQCSVDRRHHVTSYAVVLRNLIRSRRDVELLEERGVLVINDLDGGYDGVLGFVECVGSGVVMREFLYGSLFEKLNEFKVPWWRWRRREASWKLGWHRSIMVLRNDYFSNRWRVVQFAAAVVLLLLTALQTYYTVLGYY